MKNILILLSFFLFLSWLEKGRARILAGQKKGLTRAIIRHGKNKIGGKCMKKKKSIISGLLIAVLLLLVIGCDTGGGGSNPAVTYAIGDTGPSGVGIVFYVTDGGLHGLEVAPVDQSTSQVWIEGGSTQTTENGNTSTAIGTGLANSNAIIDQTGHTGSAAQVCRSYNGGGLTDWYLPSKDELNAIWDNLVDDGTGANSGVGGFAEKKVSIGRRPSSVVTTRGSRASIMASRATTVRATLTGFGLFGLFNYLSI